MLKQVPNKKRNFQEQIIEVKGLKFQISFSQKIQEDNPFFHLFRIDSQIEEFSKSVIKELFTTEMMYRTILVDFKIHDKFSHSIFIRFTPSDQQNVDFEMEFKRYYLTSRLQLHHNFLNRMTLKNREPIPFKNIIRSHDIFIEKLHQHSFRQEKECVYYYFYVSEAITRYKPYIYLKYNFRRLSLDVAKYLLDRDMVNAHLDGTPIWVRCETNDEESIKILAGFSLHPSKDNSASFSILLSTFSFYSDEKDKKNLNSVYEIVLPSDFILQTLKRETLKSRTPGLKIIKKASVKLSEEQSIGEDISTDQL